MKNKKRIITYDVKNFDKQKNIIYMEESNVKYIWKAPDPIIDQLYKKWDSALKKYIMLNRAAAAEKMQDSKEYDIFTKWKDVVHVNQILIGDEIYVDKKLIRRLGQKKKDNPLTLWCKWLGFSVSKRNTRRCMLEIQTCITMIKKVIPDVPPSTSRPSQVASGAAASGAVQGGPAITQSSSRSTVIKVPRPDEYINYFWKAPLIKFSSRI